MNFKNLPLIFLLLFIFVGSAIAQGQNTQERTIWPSLESGMGLSGPNTSIELKVVTKVDYVLSGNREHPLKPYRYSYVLTNIGKIDAFIDWKILDFLFSGPFGGPLFFKLKKGESRNFFFYSDEQPVETAGSLKVLVQDGKAGYSIFGERHLSPQDDFLPKVRSSKSNKNLLVYIGGGLATAYFPRDLWFKINEEKEKREAHKNTR